MTCTRSQALEGAADHISACSSHLPCASLLQAATCFYQLCLPEYRDILSLAAGLREALAHAEGFGLA